jgi:hypothetical protein
MAKPRLQRVPVYLERGAKKVFALAVDWPGWARSGSTDDDALAALADYADRYEPVAVRAGLLFVPAAPLEVVEAVTGNATTDFGAPAVMPQLDLVATTGAQANRLARLVEATWAALDEVVASAPPTLRKGPRGGGRDRDAVAKHCLAAEVAYARKLGVRHKEPDLADTAAIDAYRSDLLEVLRRPAPAQPELEKGWVLRYAVRRIAWHTMDHVWEIEDKSEPGGGS